MNPKNRDKLVVEICLLAGKIMIENGSEMVRVTDTIDRIAKNAGAVQARSYVTLTGIIMSANYNNGAQVISIDKRSFDLEKVSVVNDYSRKFAERKINLRQFYYALEHIDDTVPRFNKWMQLLGAAMVSGCLEIVFRDNIRDFPIACFIGMFGWVMYSIIEKYTSIKFLSEFISALGIGLLSIISINYLHLGNSVDDLIIGSIMPLVPGVPITNAVRDVLSGNLISGPSRGVEAIISACALGFGVAMAIKILG
jgi:uncharacterized membrane protein YjjP (DUF1212 family)